MGFEDVDFDDDDQQKSQENDFEYDEDFEEESVQNQSEVSDYNNLDLNKMTPEEALIHKKKMDVVFNKNIKKPTDHDYIYDKRTNFVQNKVSEWDEDDY